MAKKDKFKQMQQGGGVRSSFQDMVEQAATVAAIEKQAEQPAPMLSEVSQAGEPVQSVQSVAVPQQPTQQQPTAEQRYMRLSNPQIPITEYNLVTRYCEQFPNMTRQDFVELAIIEKLHTDGGLSQEDFNARYDEIRNRLPRGHRKGTKTLPEKSK